MTLRVTVDARPLDVGFLRGQGIGRVAHSLVPALEAVAREHGGSVLALRAADLRRPRVPERLADLPEQLLLPRDLRRLRPDVHHSLSPFRAAVRPGVPWVMTFHDAIPLRWPSEYVRTGLTYRLRYAAVRRATRLLAVSRAAARDAVSLVGVAPERVEVVPLAADERFAPVDPGPTLDRLGIPRPYVVCVAGLAEPDPRKRVRELVEAFTGWARDTGRAETLVMVGRLGPATEPVREWVSARGAPVRFPGFVADADLPAVYSGARCSVLASRFEGFGLPALESVACGTPVAAFDVGALEEVAGPGARLVDDGDFPGLMEAVAALCDHDALRARLAEEGRRHAAGFSWRRTAELTWAAYRGVA